MTSTQIPQSPRYYQLQNQDNLTCLNRLRDLILSQAPSVTENIQSNLVTFSHQGQTFAGFWTDPYTDEPYILVSGPQPCHHGVLERQCPCMQSYRIDPCFDLPLQSIKNLLEKALVNSDLNHTHKEN